MRTVFFLITAIVFSTAGVFAGELDLDLKRILDETDPGDRVKVIAYLSDSLDGRSITLEHDAMSLPANKRNKDTIVRLMNKAEETQGPLLAKLIGDQKTGDVAMIRPFWIANAIAFEATPERIQEVVRRDDIEIIYFDYPIELIEPVSKRPVIHPIGRGAVENGVAAIRADEVWDLGFDGTGVTVGVMDTGVDGNHPALTNWAGNDSDYEGNPGWAFHDPVTGQTFPFDSGSHGTHTTGTVCGQGGIGVAPGARYIHSAVIDRVSIEQTITDAIAAFEWFVNPDGDLNTSWDAPVVISNSWGLAPFFGYPECSDIFWSVIDNCEAANIVVVFAAGNEGSSPTTLRSPADRATTPYTTFAVAALDGNDPSYPAAGFSSRGPSYCGPNGEESIKPDIAAPGVDVSSSVPGSGYSNFSGTSMACPHVAGTVALLRQAAPALTVDQVKQAIYDSAVDLGEPGEDNTYGHGIVDAFEAVQIGLSTVLSLTPFDPVTIHKSVLGGPVEPSEVVYILENPTDEDTGYIVERTEVEFELLLNGGPGPLKGKLPAGTSVTFTVSIGESYLDLPAGIYNSQFRVTSTTTDIEYNRTHRLELGITDFEVTPDYGLEAGGPIGGPFTATQVYQMIGTEPTPVEIRISASEDWISVNGSNDATFTLGEGETEDVIIGFSEAANQLNNGLYQGEIAITNLTTPNNGDDTRPVILDVGRFTYVATDTPIDIVDNSELTSYVNVPDAYCVGDVNVEVDITHTFIGDLIVDLISPEGTVVRLHDRQGGSDDNIEGSYDDEGGDLIPFEPLASVDGEIVSGTWALRISDNAGADQGALNSWKLKIASSGEICPPVAFDQEISIDENATVDVVLEGASPLGEDLSFVITALPNEGSLLDGSTPITSTPTTLMGDTVNYVAAAGYVGPDDFRFRTQDSNATSEEATVLVNVGVIPYPDECSSAELVFNGSWDISTLKATSSSDPYDDAQCTGTYLGEMNQDIWLEYEACASGSITVSTCSTIDFDSDLVMYEGSCSDLQQVACNGDGSGCSNYSSIMQGDVTEGSMYLIRVGGWSDSSAGSGTIDITGPEGECASPCPADLTGDGVVNTLDLLQLVSSFGSCPGCAEDFNQDGVVNTFDLLEMVSAFGSCD